MQAQTKNKSVVGSYLLEGVMETASGFRLNKDSTFQFFFSYGALDRFGEGKWKVKNGSIQFESKPKPGNDFHLSKTSEGEKESIRITMKDMNPLMLRQVYIRVKGNNKEQEAAMNQEGRVDFLVQPIDTLEVLFDFCPEKISTFVIANKNHHSFELVPEPWLMEIFFHNFSLQQTATGLAGGHPLSNKTNFRYRKSQSQPK